MNHSPDMPERKAAGVLDCSSQVRKLVLGLALALLAACGSTNLPAPIAHRQPVPKQPGVPAAPSAVPAPQPASPDSNAAPVESAEAAPIRSGRLESRPLGASVPLPEPVPESAQPDRAVRESPNGLKRPYSASELAKVAPIPGKRVTESAAPQAGKTASGSEPSNRAPAEAQFAWPLEGRIIQRFADASSMGIAIAAPEGTPVRAAESGKVIFSGRGPRSYGNLVIVKHPNDLLSVYAHNSKLLVKEGEQVKRGQKIAEVGSSGADSARLGFEIRRQGKPIDPMSFLSQ